MLLLEALGAELRRAGHIRERRLQCPTCGQTCALSSSVWACNSTTAHTRRSRRAPVKGSAFWTGSVGCSPESPGATCSPTCLPTGCLAAPKRGRIRIGRSGRSTFRPYRPGRPCTCTGRTVSTPRRWRSSRPRRVPLAGRHGAGLIEQLRDRSREFHAHVVLDRATSEDTFLDFLTWIEEQRGVDVAVITRPVGGEYLEQSPRPPN